MDAKILAAFVLVAALAAATAYAATPILLLEDQGQPVDVGMKYCNAVRGAFSSSYNTQAGNVEYDDSIDFNHDGRINLSDFAIFGGHYGAAQKGSLEQRMWCRDVMVEMMA
ncbi:MAG: hypothetical protein NT157_00085 [Candidatus Micrarchaeota archaeon]|nr:hypothetical protein [Candidatus Micrarchaeota archaeon]